MCHPSAHGPSGNIVSAFSRYNTSDPLGPPCVECTLAAIWYVARFMLICRYTWSLSGLQVACPGTITATRNPSRRPNACVKPVPNVDVQGWRFGGPSTPAAPSRDASDAVVSDETSAGEPGVVAPSPPDETSLSTTEASTSPCAPSPPESLASASASRSSGGGAFPALGAVSPQPRTNRKQPKARHRAVSTGAS